MKIKSIREAEAPTGIVFIASIIVIEKLSHSAEPATLLTATSFFVGLFIGLVLREWKK